MLSNTDVTPFARRKTAKGQREQKKDRDLLYTAEEKKRRDETIWTQVQGVLAPLQFLVFLVSTYLVIRYLNTGDGYQLATISVIAKTSILLVIMITGAIWEKVVFGQYLLAPAFFWEDVVSFFVIRISAYCLCPCSLDKFNFRATTYVVSSLCICCIFCECYTISHKIKGC